MSRDFRVSRSSFDPLSITRPDGRLLLYYLLVSCLSLILFPVVFVPLLFKYETLHYHFDKSGVSVRWGILFRREIHLTYRRIQDIHLTRNLVQRWMGLATVTVQTASGGAGPQMTIEGILEAEQLRDFLYEQMRGARGQSVSGEPDAGATRADETAVDEELALLREIRDLLRQSLPLPGGQS